MLQKETISVDLKSINSNLGGAMFKFFLVLNFSACLYEETHDLCFSKGFVAVLHDQEFYFAWNC